MRLLHVSDTHFGTERAPVVAALQALAEALAPDLLVVSGDITQRATRAEFAAARRWLDGMPAARRLVIAGNHDIPLWNLPARLLWPYARHRAAFGRELEPMVQDATACVVGVRTTRRWRHADGTVSRSQVRRVADCLHRAPPAAWRIVVTHQPVAVTRVEDLPNLLHGHAAAVRGWAAAGADLVLGGHIHLPYVLALHERDATLPRRLWAVQAGTAVSSRLRREAGNSVNVLDFDDGDPGQPALVTRWDHEAQASRFVEVSRQALWRTPPGTGGLNGAPGTGGLTGAPGTGGLTGAPGTGGLTGAPGTGGLTGAPGTGGLTGAPGTGGLTGAPGTGGLNGGPGPAV